MIGEVFAIKVNANFCSSRDSLLDNFLNTASCLMLYLLSSNAVLHEFNTCTRFCLSVEHWGHLSQGQIQENREGGGGPDACEGGPDAHKACNDEQLMNARIDTSASHSFRVSSKLIGMLPIRILRHL